MRRIFVNNNLQHWGRSILWTSFFFFSGVASEYLLTFDYVNGAEPQISRSTRGMNSRHETVFVLTDEYIPTLWGESNPYVAPSKYYGIDFKGKYLGFLNLSERPRVLDIDGKVDSKRLHVTDDNLSLAIENVDVARFVFTSSAAGDATEEIARLCRLLSRGGYADVIKIISSAIEVEEVGSLSNRAGAGGLFRDYLRLLGVAYELNGNFPEALDVYAALYGEGSDDYLWAEARILYATGNKTEAIRFVVSAITRSLHVAQPAALDERLTTENGSEVSYLTFDSISDVKIRAELWRLRAQCAQIVCPEFFFVALDPDEQSDVSSPNNFNVLQKTAFDAFVEFMESGSKEEPSALALLPFLQTLTRFSYDTNSTFLHDAFRCQRIEFMAHEDISDLPAPDRLCYDVLDFAPIPIESQFIANLYSCYSPNRIGGLFIKERESILVPLARGQYSIAAKNARESLAEYCPWRALANDSEHVLVFQRGSFFRKTLLLLASALELDGKWTEALNVYSALYDQNSVDYIWVLARLSYAVGAYEDAYALCCAALDASLATEIGMILQEFQGENVNASNSSFRKFAYNSEIWKCRESCARVICPELHYVSRLPSVKYDGIPQGQKLLNELQVESFNTFCNFMSAESAKAGASVAEGETSVPDRMKLLQILAKIPSGVRRSGM